MFDPEKVGRYDLDRSYRCGNAIMEMCERGDYVNSSDYDQLLALYQGTEKSRAAAMRQIERLTDALRRDECSAVNNSLSKPPSDPQPRFVETSGELWDNEEQSFWVRKALAGASPVV